MSNTELFPAFKKNNIAICCSTDTNYLAYCSVMFQSLIEYSNQENNYDLIVLESGLSAIDKKRLCTIIKGLPNFSMRFFNMREMVQKKKFYTPGRYPMEMYYRLWCGSIFKNYEKIVYLDVDIILRSDVGELFYTDIHDKWAAACLDYAMVAKVRCGKYHGEEYFVKDLGLKKPCETYFNSGVMILRIAAMQSLEGKLLKTASDSLSKRFKYPDQDVLNIVLNGHIHYLDISWNTYNEAGTRTGIMHLVPEPYLSEWRKNRVAPKLIHYSSDKKPWDLPQTDLAHVWWDVARRTTFYEEIMYKYINKQANSVYAKALVIAKYAQYRKELRKYRLLCHFSFGKKRDEYMKKIKALKATLKRIEASLR